MKNNFYKIVENIVDKWAISEDGTIKIEWTIGGMTGGNCWEGSKDCVARSADPEPEFEYLNKILENLCPDIKFLQYKRLCQEIIKTDNRYESGYYGNHYEYAIKSFKISDLEKYLKENNLWEDVS